MSDSDTPGARAARPSTFVVALVVLCLALAGLDVVLVLQNRELSARVGELTRLVHAAERPLDALDGRPFPVTTLVDADGTSLGLTEIPETHATLLLLSSPACEHCELAYAAWDRAARRAAGTHLRVLGLALDTPREGLRTVDTPYPRLAPGEGEAELLRVLPGVPAAVLVDAQGVVLGAVYGGEQTGLDELVDGFLETSGS